jgi:hypothetical protein
VVDRVVTPARGAAFQPAELGDEAPIVKQVHGPGIQERQQVTLQIALGLVGSVVRDAGRGKALPRPFAGIAIPGDRGASVGLEHRGKFADGAPENQKSRDLRRKRWIRLRSTARHAAPGRQSEAIVRRSASSARRRAIFLKTAYFAGLRGEVASGGQPKGRRTGTGTRAGPSPAFSEISRRTAALAGFDGLGVAVRLRRRHRERIDDAPHAAHLPGDLFRPHALIGRLDGAA